MATLSRFLRLRPLPSSFWQYSTPKLPPLRILFAGSDNFSATSLSALHQAHVTDPSLIGSIDVLCREDGRTGRKRDILKEVPIKAVAQNLGLPLHTISSFKDFQLSTSSFDLIIAVSFGLFIPASIITSLPYGGLNVHPSLLPRYRGAAPIQRTLLNHDAETGVTIQTLDTKRFDHGAILMQSSPPVKIYPRTSYHALHDKLAVRGAEMLVETLRRQLFVPPISAVQNTYEASLAPKITPEDAHIDWAAWGADEMELRAEMLGEVWTELGYEMEQPDVPRKRAILYDIKALDFTPELDIPVGCFRYLKREYQEMMVLKCKDGEWVRVGAVKVEGKRVVEGGTWIRSLQKRGIGRRFY